jgi:hypothetical protein
LAAEGVFALCWDFTDSFTFTNVSRRWYRRHVRMNNLQFRDTIDYHPESPDQRLRIAFIGDSFTYGHGVADVERIFPKQVAGMLERDFPGRFEVHNLSSPGWSTHHQIECLQTLSRNGYHADLIVLIYVLNDNDDLLTQYGESFSLFLGSKRSDLFIIRDSYLLNFLYYRVMLFSSPLVRDYYHWSLAGYDGATWEQQQDRLQQLHRCSASLGARFCVATFPYVHNLGSADAYASVYRKLRLFWTNESVAYLDLYGVLRPHASRGLAVHAFDAHPNETAHALAAEAIYHQLVLAQIQHVREDSSAGLGRNSVVSGERVE